MTVSFVTLFQDCSNRHDLPKNMVASGRGLFSIYTCICIENVNDLLVRNHGTNFNITLHDCFFCNPLPRLLKPSWIVKNMASRRRCLIFLYIYIENFKNLLVRNHWTDFMITWQKCFLGDPPGLIFPIYMYIKNFKNLLVRNLWTDFKITWQECFFGDPLPKLFKPLWFVKKHGRKGRGLFFLYISIFPIYLYTNL